MHHYVMQGKIITAVIFIYHNLVETVKDQNTHKQKDITALTVLDVCLRLVCFQSNSTFSALEVLHVMRYINLRLTYLRGGAEVTCSNIWYD